MKILLDTGHQDSLADFGANGIVREYDHNAAIVDACEKYFSFVRVPDGTGSLINTINWINKNSTADDVLISVHTNAGGGTGNEVWYYGGSDYSKKKGEELAKFLKNRTGLADRGAKADTSNQWGRLGIVRDTKPAAWLIECGFIEQTQDMGVPADLFALAIADFVASLGVAVNVASNPTVTQSTERDGIRFDGDPKVYLWARSAEEAARWYGSDWESTVRIIPVDGHIQQINGLNSVIDAKNAQISDLNVQLVDKENIINNERKDCEKRIADTNTEISILNKKIDALTAEINDNLQVISAQNASILDLKSKVVVNIPEVQKEATISELLTQIYNKIKEALKKGK